MVNHEGFTSVLGEGHYLYVVGGSPNARIYIVDVADPTHPAIVSSFASEFAVGGWFVQDGYLYGAYSDNRYFAIADVRDPSNPVLTQFPQIPSPFSETAIVSDENRLYSASSGSELNLRIYTLKSPIMPYLSLTHQTPLPCSPTDRQLLPNGDYLYVTDKCGVTTYRLMAGITQFLPLLQRDTSP